MENNQIKKQIFNKVTAFILWIISVLILAIIFNAEIIGRKGFFSGIFQSMLGVFLFNIIICVLFSIKKKDNQRITSSLEIASILNALLIIGGLYNIFSK